MALNPNEIKLEIKGAMGNGLQKEILNDLGKVTMELDSKKIENDEVKDDKIKMFPFNADKIKQDYGTEPRMMKDVPTKNQLKYTGTEAMIEVIVEKTVDKMIDVIVDNILNKLEITIPKSTVIVAVAGNATGTPNPSPIFCNKK